MATKRKASFKFRMPEFVLVILILSSGMMLAFSSGSFVVNFKTIGFTVFSTIQKEVHALSKGIMNMFTAGHELVKLRRDYDALVKKLENYEQMRRSNTGIRKENERLREQLKFSNSLEEKNYPAQIIARDTDNIDAYFTIDKGSSSGIKKNMPVIAYQDGNSGLVGKIVQVGKFTSIVMPVYNVNCTVSARIQNTRNIGLVSGKGNYEGTLSMKYIRKRVLPELHFGDVIVTSGENNNYMRDLPLGTISKISVTDYNSSLDIELLPIIDFSRIENVIVVNLYETNDIKE
ncbi:MAG: rod shape-determining protein MreC [Treponema sp.]|nr:rod shape-determining protein MreC [Treponema sp.]MDE6244694.1 rod shape-determining protein MreC [Treponemataceae bacterium]MBD5404269.1 rod shape-determining protein MreC [Treponema sp.]MBD5406932.1 rod shape-determining protein MreC [Treponema sp.]MBD5408272.1 rod shape-determining protein MreC [Treponema sp.]